MKLFDVVGWDNGYEFEKLVVGPGQRILFPSVVYKPPAGLLTEPAPFQLSSMSLTYNEEEYFVGEYAIDQDSLGGHRIFRKDKFREPSEIVKFLAGVTILSEATKEVIVKNIVVGLSLQTYKKYNREVVNQFEESIYEFSLSNHETIAVYVENVICVPQGIGAFFDELLDYNARPKKDDLLASRYGLIDVGGKTVDAFISQGANPVRGSDIGLSYGTSDVFKQVLDKEVPAILIERAFTTGRAKLFWDGRYYDYRAETEKQFKRLAQNIYKAVQVEWTRHLDRVEMILLCGGGATVIADYLKQLFSIEVKVVREPQFANARGYYKLGRHNTAGIK